MKRSEKYWWYNDESATMLSRGYLLDGETIQDAVNRIATTAASYLGDAVPNAKAGITELIERGWISLSTPIWSNFGAERGLPISCFGSYVGDTMKSITEAHTEVVMQTKSGGGTSAYFGAVRGRGTPITGNGVSNGSVSFMRMFDTAIAVTSQGSIRRGNMAVYTDIDHKDIEEFLSIKDIGSEIQNLFMGVNVTDAWMTSMIAGDADKRKIWARVLESRRDKGLPYINFIDTVNKNKPTVYKDKNIPIYASNLCAEIGLPSSDIWSFVCCLCSMNLELYDEWKDTDAAQYAIYLLDAVMSEFIKKTKGKYGLERSHRFAVDHRALGLGVLGYHAYLQKNNIAFESMEAKQLNHSMFKNIKENAVDASKHLASVLGEPELLKGYGLRNTTLMAIAPTTSSSSILGQTSPSIEPYSSNYFKVGLAKGNFIRKNKYLKALLIEKGQDVDEVWDSIMNSGGSVQHLPFLTDHEKNVFKTFKEISQMEIVIQASIRQKFICQSQSLNINIPPGVSPKEVNALYIEAWKLGVKSLYYQRSESVSQNLIRSIMNCSACEA